MRCLKTTIRLLLPALLALSCAREKPPSHSPTSINQSVPLVQVEKIGSYKEAVELIRATTLECASSECPPSVGLFLAADKAGGFAPDSDSVAACTAVLVGEDLALTNSHCIPSAVKLLPDLCSERIRITFPATAHSAEESFACSALLGHSERATSTSPDLALLKLEKKTSRPYPALNRSGVANSTPLLSVKVNPHLKNKTGTIVSEYCVSAAGSYRMPIYRDESSPSLVMGDCTAIPGNSGSPLFDKTGNLTGLMQAALPISENSFAEWSKLLEKSEESITSLALATSLICYQGTLPAWEWNTLCATVTEEDVARARPRIRQFLSDVGLETRTEATLKRFRDQSPLLQLERIARETRTLRRKETLAPHCMTPPSSWTTSFLDSDGKLLEQAELSLDLPEISLELRFNRFLQLTSPAAQLSGSAQKKFLFSPRAAAERGELELRSTEDGAITLLPSCPF